MVKGSVQTLTTEKFGPKTPAVSVVMAVYNGARFLREAIDSVLGQSFSDFEFVIVNDGSTDESSGILAGYLDKRIKIIDLVHGGLTTALNAGLHASSGELIARMDADDIALPDRLLLQHSYLATNPDVAAVCSDILVINSDSKVTGREVLNGLDNELLRESLLFKQVTKPIVHPTAMIRRSVFEQVGGYREFPYAEDHDFWIRAVDDFQVRRLNHILLKYRVHPGANSRRIVQQGTSGCLSAINYMVKEATGVDIFETRPALFEEMERVVTRRVTAEVMPVVGKFRSARNLSRTGQPIRGLLAMATGFAEFGITFFPRSTIRRYRAIIEDLASYGISAVKPTGPATD